MSGRRINVGRVPVLKTAPEKEEEEEGEEDENDENEEDEEDEEDAEDEEDEMEEVDDEVEIQRRSSASYQESPCQGFQHAAGALGFLTLHLRQYPLHLPFLRLQLLSQSRLRVWSIEQLMPAWSNDVIQLNLRGY